MLIIFGLVTLQMFSLPLYFLFLFFLGGGGGGGEGGGGGGAGVGGGLGRVKKGKGGGGGRGESPGGAATFKKKEILLWRPPPCNTNTQVGGTASS